MVAIAVLHLPVLRCVLLVQHKQHRLADQRIHKIVSSRSSSHSRVGQHSTLSMLLGNTSVVNRVHMCSGAQLGIRSRVRRSASLRRSLSARSRPSFLSRTSLL